MIRFNSNVWTASSIYIVLCVEGRACVRCSAKADNSHTVLIPTVKCSSISMVIAHFIKNNNISHILRDYLCSYPFATILKHVCKAFLRKFQIDLKSKIHYTYKEPTVSFQINLKSQESGTSFHIISQQLTTMKGQK